MGLVRMGPPEKLILKLQKAFNISLFVETGTFHAQTAVWASRHFDEVITIENSQSLYQKAADTYGSIENIRFLYGNSKQILKELSANLERPGLFWLDAHWSGGETYGKTEECPLLDELLLINNSSCDHFIFIDDARLFLSPPPPPHQPEQWPDICRLIGVLVENCNNYFIVIIEDVIIVVPQNAKSILTQYCQETNLTGWQANTVNPKAEKQYIRQIIRKMLEGVRKD